MKFKPAFKPAKLLKRYKRFLADAVLEDGSETTLHCPNTGSMRNCSAPGSRIWYSTSDSRTRKYPHTFEIIEVAGKYLAGINTGRANGLVREAIESGLVRALAGYGSVRQEVKYGEENSRIDLLLQEHGGRPGQACYIEVKNVTLAMADGMGLFPDAVSVRGTKHLRELMTIVARGDRAVLFFCVQHTGATCAGPAEAIDPEYCRSLHQALAFGVEVLCYRCQLASNEIVIDQSIPFQWY